MNISHDDYLEHYGVKGMKWGVRRYEKSGGNYTKKGVETFRKAESKYDAAKSEQDRLKKSGASKSQIKAAKNNTKSAKRDLKGSYKALKQDRLADKGRDMYRSGKTVTDLNRNHALAQVGIVGGSLVAERLLKQRGMAGTKYDAILGAGVAGLTLGLEAKKRSDTKKLRAYYGHTGYKVRG